MSFTLVPAVGDRFIDRKEIISEIVATLASPKVYMGFALIGARRMGKTSILKESARILNKKKKIVAVYFSIWELDDNRVDSFCKKLVEKTLTAFKKRLSIKYRLKNLVAVPAAKIIDFLKTIGLEIKLLREVEIKIYAAENNSKDFNSAGEKIETAFRLIDKLAKDLNIKAVLMIDEFPALMDLKNGEKLGPQVMKKIRTLQEDYQNTVLCISGSIKRSMELTVLEASSAFYRQFIIKQIGTFSKSVTKMFLEKNLHIKLKKEVVDKVFSLTAGIPFYLQFLGRTLERKKESPLSVALIEKTYEEFLKEEGNLIFTEEFSHLTDLERAILLVISKENLSEPGEIGKYLNEPGNKISRYIEYLLNKGLIEKKSKGKYLILDPCFIDWLARR